MLSQKSRAPERDMKRQALPGKRLPTGHFNNFLSIISYESIDNKTSKKVMNVGIEEFLINSFNL